MKIFISEEDRQNAKRIALKNIAPFLSISDVDVKSNDTLLKEISSLQSDLAKKILPYLMDYFQAYDNWFQFYKEKKEIEKKDNKDYVLTPSDNKVLPELIFKRQVALEALQKQFDEIQIMVSNREAFGKDISGTID